MKQKGNKKKVNKEYDLGVGCDDTFKVGILWHINTCGLFNANSYFYKTCKRIVCK